MTRFNLPYKVKKVSGKRGMILSLISVVFFGELLVYLLVSWRPFDPSWICATCIVAASMLPAMVMLARVARQARGRGQSFFSLVNAMLYE